MSQRKLGWEIASKTILMLMVMIYAIAGIPLGWMWLQEKRTIAALPVVTVDDSERAGEYRRRRRAGIRGGVLGAAQHRPRRQ